MFFFQQLFKKYLKMPNWNIDFEIFSKTFLEVIKAYMYFLYNISNNFGRDKGIKQRKFESVKIELNEFLNSQLEFIKVQWITFPIDSHVKTINFENFEDEIKLETFTDKTNALIFKMLDEDREWYENKDLEMGFKIFTDKVVLTAKRLMGVKKLSNEDWKKFFDGGYNLLNRGNVTHPSYEQKAADVWNRLLQFYYKNVTPKRIDEMVYSGSRDGLQRVCDICMDVELNDVCIEICRMDCGKYF